MRLLSRVIRTDFLEYLILLASESGSRILRGMAKTATLNLRVAPEFKRRLIEEAAKEKRSVTNYLEVTLSNVWERKADLSGPKEKQKRGR
jgi:hypothetical protein